MLLISFCFVLPSTSLWGVYSETFIHRYNIPLTHAFTRLCMNFFRRNSVKDSSKPRSACVPYSFSCIKISHCRMFFDCFFSIRISCHKQNGAHGDNRCCLNATTTYPMCLARYKNVAREVLISLSIFSDPL